MVHSLGMTDQDQIAAFLAQRGATQCGSGIAYGVNAEADKAKRTAERARRREEEEEAAYERRMELAHDAFHTGDVEEGYAQMTGWRRVAPGRYVRA